jgi:hypothetical protein
VIAALDRGVSTGTGGSIKAVAQIESGLSPRVGRGGGDSARETGDGERERDVVELEDAARAKTGRGARISGAGASVPAGAGAVFKSVRTFRDAQRAQSGPGTRQRMVWATSA